MKTLRYLPLIAALCLLLAVTLLLSACGGETNTTEETSTEITTEETTTEITTTVPETTEAEPVWVNAIFGGGPFTTGGSATANILKNTSFNTLMLWSVHVQKNGDLHMNDIPIVRNGKLVSSSISRTWDMIREQCPNITRIELSIGGWGCTDFENIRDLIAAQGTGEDSILYKNFKVLMEATHADAVNYDDESCYDVTSAAAFGEMCLGLGMKVTFCPYTQMNFWKSLYNKLGKEENVDRIYLQCYVGGAGNNPLDWSRQFGNTLVIPGYYNREKTTSQVQTTLKTYQACSEGGFMWLFDEMMTGTTAKDYADAIEKAGEGKVWN